MALVMIMSRSRSFATVTVGHDNSIDYIKPPPIIEDSSTLEDLSILEDPL